MAAKDEFGVGLFAVPRSSVPVKSPVGPEPSAVNSPEKTLTFESARSIARPA